jgi:hypothetical protein
MIRFIVKQCFNLLLVVVVLSFLGVEPLSTYKNSLLDKLSDVSQSAQQEDNNATSTAVITTPITKVTTPITKTVAPAPTLKNPSWSQLLDFLVADKTDEIPYNYPTFVCDNFASTLQSNAKKAGWRCAKVTLGMVGYTDPYRLGIAQDAGHSCNAFETVDRGLVYIDCTGNLPGVPCPPNGDSIVNVVVGNRYIPEYIFPNGGWYFDDMGVVTKISVRW